MVDNVVADLDRFLLPAGKQAQKALPADPLDQALLGADEQLARDLKRTTVRRMLTEEQGKLLRAEGSLPDGEAGTTRSSEQAEVDPKVLQFIVGLPDDQQQKAMEAYATLQAANGMRGQPSLMPILLAQMNARPKDSTAEIVTAVTKIFELVESRQVPPKSDVLEFAEAFQKLSAGNKQTTTGEVAQLVTAIAGVVREGQAGPPAADPTQTALEMLRSFKDLGLINIGNQGPAVPSGMTDETQIRLAEIRRDTDLKLAELGLKKDTDMRRLDNDEKRTQAIGGLIERAAKVAGRAFAEGEEEVEGTAVVQSAPAGEMATVNCPSCKKQIGIPQPTKARNIQCPHCNSPLAWDGKP